MTKNKTSPKDDLMELINARIENLRPKLLDLTRRNPLLSTKFSDRSHSHIRIVDELPQILFTRLMEGKMKFVPLPPLEADPKDEQSRKFKNVLTNARLTDEIYIRALEAIDQNEEDSAEKLAIAERELKDKIREKLKMPARQTKTSLSLVQHARNNDILPIYDLLLSNEENSDGRHHDDAIQTLLLPDMLEKRLNSIMSKCNTWIEETGINVLRAAFGFLEWTESTSSESALAPLLLLPVEIEKKKTREGFEYTVCGLGDPPEINTVLIEKLKREFGIDLPVFNLEEEGSLEDYFNEVGRITLKGMTWRVRRQVAIGVFPSARMAMYHDLDTKLWDFHTHEVISGLLGGKNVGNGSTPFGDEYEIDHPDVEMKVPMIITDADASQFSVIVDVMDDKSVAVEGPPGSGKSQTIVNTIAVALSHGKKVLFVAEKTAALEVVRSRLEACGLGEFLLTLQATRSSKEKVIESIRERLQIPAEKEPPGLDEKIQQFKTTRTQLNDYIQIISSQFANTGFTIHDILGYGMHAQKKLASYAQELSQVHVAGVRSISQENINEIIHFCSQLETAWEKTNSLKPYWGKIQKPNIDPYTAVEILQITKGCAECSSKSYLMRERFFAMGMDQYMALKDVINLINLLTIMKEYEHRLDTKLIKRMMDSENLPAVNQFFIDIEEARKSKRLLSDYIFDPLSREALYLLERLVKISEVMNLKEISEVDVERKLIEINQKLILQQENIFKVEEILRAAPFLRNRPIHWMVALCDVSKKISRSMLSLRTRRLSEASSKEFIVKASQKANELQQQKVSLTKEFLIDSFVNEDELKLNISSLMESGTFCFFLPKFHRAKKFYQTISKDRSFEKHRAITKLRQVYQWQRDVNAFNNDAILKELLGSHFNGYKTDFLLFLELINFYDDIETRFNGIENLDIRKLLKEGEIDIILALPELSDTHPLRREDNNCRYKQLLDQIIEINNQIKIFEEMAIDVKKASSILKKPSEINLEMLKGLIENLLKFQSQWKSLNENNSIQEILGEYFDGPNTEFNKIKESFSFLKNASLLGSNFPQILIPIIEKKQILDLLSTSKDLVEADNAWEESLTKFTNIVNVKTNDIIGSFNGREIVEFFEKASKDKEGLIAHSILYANKQEIVTRGCGDVVDSLICSKHGLKNLADLTKAVLIQSLIKEVYKDYGNILARYDGNKLNHLRKRLAELDRQIIELSQKRLRVKLRRQANPPEGIGGGRRSEWTEMALLNNEISKKKRLLPVRDLTKRAGKALLEIKPCWMMSPLAVAQYIEKGRIKFDLVIIDEASQMTPEDAIGALARSKQAMVVGDTNQLPPTPFFKKIIDDMEEEEDESVLEESILEMANAVFRPARRLRWHYRSKHPGLIAFSNRYVYDDDLTIFPSPDINKTDKGVSFHAVKGFYSKGTNPIEATEIVNAAIKFMHNHKDMSLGIVVLNQKQQELVDEQMQYVIAHDPIAQEYIEKWKSSQVRYGLEPFFVKNLENVQGDERDVIFIGTVYGPEREGAPVMQRFGPINGIAGKRRLNVLFTRAKHKIVTFSSMTANDIRVDNHSNKGVELFQAWLEYCASGKLLERELTEREPGSPFEEFIISQLKAIGCHPECQVGVAGYFIDIGIKHPEWPHGFIMGVECDGRTYHSSKSARDRDRLREEVLIGLGWNLHRIWSTDWFNDPVYESQRLREIIENRLKELKRSI